MSLEAAAFRPSSTPSSADALEAKADIRTFLSREERWMPFIEWFEDGTPDAQPGFDVQLYGSWTMAVQDSTPVMWIAPDLVDAIVQSSDSVPELGDFDELRVPMSGLIVLGAPVMNPDDQMTISVLTWTRGVGPDGEAALNVNPWPWVPDLRGLTPGYPLTTTRSELDRRATALGIGWADDGLFWLRLFAAIFGWLDSVAERTDERAPKATRRRLERTGVAKIDPVTTLKLRELEHRPTGPQDSGGREYSHRWIVSGHWRTVRCGPGRTRRKAVYIAPHVAGPPDKPLIPKDRIWAVDR